MDGYTISIPLATKLRFVGHKLNSLSLNNNTVWLHYRAGAGVHIPLTVS